MRRVTCALALAALAACSPDKKDERTLSRVEVAPAAPTAFVGSTTQFTATAFFSDGTSSNATLLAAWTSDAPSVLSVSDAAGTKGVAQALDAGQARVKATFEGVSGFADATVVREVHLVSIEIQPAAPAIFVGGTVALVAMGTFDDSTVAPVTDQATWTSDAPLAATVSDDATDKGIATGLSAMVPDGALWLLVLLRFFVGIGVGGELPVASTYVSEFAPAAHRGRLLVILESFWAYGWIAAALVGYFLVPQFGWRVAFFVGALPALYVFVLRQMLPESPRFLMATGRADEANRVVSEVEARAGARSPGAAAVEAAVPTAGGGSGLARLWRFPRRTLMLWILWFGIVFTYYGIFTYVPSLLVARGLTVSQSNEYFFLSSSM